jgi:predicted metal-dependent hydrolase
MPAKTVEISEIGTVKLFKRKGAKNIRLSFSRSGEVRVTIPAWAPYAAGTEFARVKTPWIIKHRPPANLLQDNQRIGKAHQLKFVSATSSRISTRIRQSEIFIGVPAGIAVSSDEVQQAAKNAAVKALKNEAEQLLPQRLAILAKNHGFEYKSVRIKQMKGRWGSCSQHRDITLNCYLMQLPWDLIDYVLLHELLHTKIMAHGPKFWAEMESLLPNIKIIRQQMRIKQPILSSINSPG